MASRTPADERIRLARVAALAGLGGVVLLGVVVGLQVAGFATVGFELVDDSGTPADGPAGATRMDGPSDPARPTGRQARFPAPGSVARDFALPVLLSEEPWIGADTVRLSDYAGRWVYLDVFGSWCLPCRTKYPKTIEVARELEAEGAAVVGLLLEDRPATAAAWIEENGGFTYPFLVLDHETASEWQMTGAPMGFLVSPDGRIERRCYGCARGADAIERLPDRIR